MTKCSKMLDIKGKLAQKLAEKLNKLRELDNGSPDIYIIRDKVNELKLRVKEKKTEREMYFTRRTLCLDERDRIVQGALLRLSNKQFSVSTIALKQELAAIDMELKEVEQGLARVVPEYLDTKRELERHVEHQKQMSDLAEALSHNRAIVVKLRKEMSALSMLLSFFVNNNDESRFDLDTAAENLMCTSARFSSSERKDILLLILERRKQENRGKDNNDRNNDEEAVII